MQIAKSNFSAEVSVLDQGDGVPEDMREKIFGEFAQSAVDMKNKMSSTGLGLSISKKIVEHHGGQIGCYNQKNGGAVFYFQIPIKRGK